MNSSSTIILRNRIGHTVGYQLSSFAFLAIGCFLHILSYQSFEPVFACFIFFVLGAWLLNIPSVGGIFERAGFRLIFSTGWFVAGIAALSANYINDAGQRSADSLWFFELSAAEIQNRTSLTDFQQVTEGAAAVVIWRAVYNTFAALGFGKDYYLGILVNITAIAFCSVLAVKTARLVYGDDAPRLKRLIILISLCGLFWLFAAIHLRDGFILLSITVLAYIWTRYLSRPSIFGFFSVIGFTVFAFSFLGYLRWEFRFVPIAVLAAGLAAILLFDRPKGLQKIIIYTVAIIGIVAMEIFYPDIPRALLNSVTKGYRDYQSFSIASSSSDSLGMSLIVNQPIYIRLVLGSFYLYLYPIPFWSGFQFGSIYHLFKSFNVLFFYAVIPLVFLSLLQILCRKSVRKPALMFLLFLAAGFTLTVAGTSLETRHIGVFFIPLFVLALLPDLTQKKYRLAYMVFLGMFLFAIILLHYSWLLLKF